MNSESHRSSQVIQILLGESVFDRDTDSKIRHAGNAVSARLMFEILNRFDALKGGWESAFAEAVMKTAAEPSVLIGFDDGRWQGLEDEKSEIQLEDNSPESADYYLKLEFTDEDACFYQFHLFPAFAEPFVLSAARKRANEFQYVQITLSHPEDLQIFIQNLRSNPHLKRVHDSTMHEFNEAPSQST